MISQTHVDAALRVALLLSAQKSVNEVTREYDDTLTRFCFDVLLGGDAVDFRRSHKALLRALAPEAYAEGLREGGVDADEQDDDDRATVSGWVDEQVSHVNDFAAWLAGGEPRNSEDKRRELGERVGLWVQSLESLGSMGRASAKANQMGTWRRKGDKDSCDTCVELDGQRHRLKWFLKHNYIPRQPGSESLECKGYECECGVYADGGERIL
jgi:hypothetical protein